MKRGPLFFAHAHVWVIKPHTASADPETIVGRAAGLLFVLAGLIASAFAFVHHMQTPPKGTMETVAAKAAVAELKDAGDQLYLTKKWAGTYDGPDLKNFRDLQLVRADDFGFCIQVVKEAQVFRLVGPGREPEPGRC